MSEIHFAFHAINQLLLRICVDVGRRGDLRPTMIHAFLPLPGTTKAPNRDLQTNISSSYILVFIKFPDRTKLFSIDPS